MLLSHRSCHSHDGLISSLRTYSPSALRALAAHAGPAIELELHGGPLSEQVGDRAPEFRLS